MVEPTYVKIEKNQANIFLLMNKVRRVETEVLVYDTSDMIGAIGGSLGLFLGFSFFDVISKCLDNFLIRLITYLFPSIWSFCQKLFLVIALQNNISTATSTGKYLSEALIIASTNPQYDDRFFHWFTSSIHENSKLKPWKNMLKLFLKFRTIFVHDMFSQWSAQRRASDKDLPVLFEEIHPIMNTNRKYGTNR